MISPPRLKALSTGVEEPATPSIYRASLLNAGIFFRYFLDWIDRIDILLALYFHTEVVA